MGTDVQHNHLNNICTHFYIHLTLRNSVITVGYIDLCYLRSTFFPIFMVLIYHKSWELVTVSFSLLF